MAFTQQQIDKVWAKLMDDLPRHAIKTAVLKGELKDAVVAADTFINGIKSDYNQALPVAYRTTASTKEKALLFFAVALEQLNGS